MSVWLEPKVQKAKCSPEIVCQSWGPINEDGQEGANASGNKNMLHFVPKNTSACQWIEFKDDIWACYVYPKNFRI